MLWSFRVVGCYDTDASPCIASGGLLARDGNPMLQLAGLKLWRLLTALQTATPLI
jgi:hypothetical protein